MIEPKRVSFITLGCKTNQYETNAMEQKFKSSGYEIVNYNDKIAIIELRIPNGTEIKSGKED